MFLVGLSLRSLDDALDARSTLSGALFVAIVFITIVKQEMDVSTFLATVPVLTVTWIIGSKLIFSRQSRSGERSAKDGHPERKMVIA
jgi:hypothetical protein